jgi:hypothetical protein
MNPPFNQQILLEARDGTWGFGFAYKLGGKVYFNYSSHERLWFGEPKEKFRSFAVVI